MPGITGRWKLGLALALTTATLWSVLPIALKLALQGIDPYTITWYRFATSSVVLGLILAASGQLPTLGSLGQRGWLMLCVALAGLVGNFVFYLVALSYVEPSVAQTVIQLAPMCLLLGGVVFFKERLSGAQRTGLLVLTVGLLLFFNQRLLAFRSVPTGFRLGVVILIVASVTWAAYGLAQTELLKQFGSQQVLWLLYLGATIVLLPSASLGAVRHVSGLVLWMLAFSCLNTVVAYGAFAEALRHWEVSRVSAVLAAGPLITIASSSLLERIVPGLLPPDRLNVISVVGAFMVVLGSATCALVASTAPGDS